MAAAWGCQVTARVPFPDEVIAAICGDIRSGLPEKHACALAGVGDRAFRRAMERGAEEADAGEDTENAGLYSAVTRARAEFMRAKLAEHAAALSAADDGKSASRAREIWQEIIGRWPDLFSPARVKQTVDQTVRTAPAEAGASKTVEEIDREIDAIMEARGLRVVPKEGEAA